MEISRLGQKCIMGTGVLPGLAAVWQELWLINRFRRETADPPPGCGPSDPFSSCWGQTLSIRDTSAKRWTTQTRKTHSNISLMEEKNLGEETDADLRGRASVSLLLTSISGRQQRFGNLQNQMKFNLNIKKICFLTSLKNFNTPKVWLKIWLFKQIWHSFFLNFTIFL